MIRKVFIGSVIIHQIGTNPYHRDIENPYRSGENRVKALRQFRDTGKLPEGFAAWNDDERVDIPDRTFIDWSHMRD